MKDLILFIWYLALVIWLYGNWIGNLGLRVCCTVVLILTTYCNQRYQQKS